MTRFNYEWSDQKLQSYIKQGKGSGEGSAYEPWLSVHSIPSRGRVSRISGWKTNRVHHFLSDNEVRYFYLCEWSDSVVDIREHYPLIDLYEHTEILDADLTKKLIDRKTGTPHILTTSFLLTISNDHGKTHIARSIKETRELEKSAVIERYEVIRRYWNKKGVSWALVTPSEINEIRAKTIEWLHSARRLSDWGYSEADAARELHLMMEMLSYGKGTIGHVIERFETETHGEHGKGLLLFKHLLSTKRIMIDMDKPFHVHQSADQVKVHTAVKGSDKVVGG